MMATLREGEADKATRNARVREHSRIDSKESSSKFACQYGTPPKSGSPCGTHVLRLRPCHAIRSNCPRACVSLEDGVRSDASSARAVWASLDFHWPHGGNAVRLSRDVTEICRSTAV